MKKMKAATGLTYIDGTWFESEVFMASKISNLSAYNYYKQDRKP
jgi:hypothetical protein